MEGINMPVIQKLKNLFGRNVFYVVTQEEMPRVGKMSARQSHSSRSRFISAMRKPPEDGTVTA